MKITVKYKGMEIIIDRPDFEDVKKEYDNQKRTNIMNDSVLPTLEQIIEKIKELTKDEM